MTATIKPKSGRCFARAPKADNTPLLTALADCKDLSQAELSAATGKTEAVPQPRSTISGVSELLQRGDGATLDEMVTATGWLATPRALR